MRFRWWHVALGALVSAAMTDYRAFKREQAEHAKVVQLQNTVNLLSISNEKAISTINAARSVNEDAMRRLYICEAIR